MESDHPYFIGVAGHLAMCGAMRSASVVDAELKFLLENETQSCPGTSWSSRRKERGMLERKLSTYSGKRPSHESSVFRETRRTKLRGAVVLAIKEIVDVCKNLNARMNLIAAGKVKHGVTWCTAGTQIITSIGFMVVVLISKGI